MLAVAATGCFNPAHPTGILFCDGADQGACPTPQTCNALTHVCVDPGADVDAPTIESAAFVPPAVSGGVARLRIEADEALTADPPPVAVFAPGTPSLPLVPGAADGNAVELVVDVDDAAAVPEGTYVVTHVDVADASLNPAGRDVTAALVVDRTGPQILNARVLSPAGLSDVGDATATTLVVAFQASEPLAPSTDSAPGAGIRVGALAEVPCDVDAALAVTCTVALAGLGALLDDDGLDSITLVARDAAGNEATKTDLVAAVDVDAPGIVGDSVEVSLSSASGDVQAAASAGTRIRVVLIADEPLATPPLLVVDGAPQIAFSVEDVAGNRFTLGAVVPGGVAEGARALGAHLVDRFGHAADVVLAGDAPAAFPAIDFGASSVSACPSADPCVDADGDGFIAAGACAAGNDCNDVDPTVFPGAPEIAGDGVANDCSADADAAIDEAHGFFVDCDAAVDGDGSRDAPFNSLDAAAVGVERAFMFLRASAAPCTFASGGSNFIRAGVVGGLDVDWQRSADSSVRTAVEANPPGAPVLDANIAIEAVAFPFGAELAGRVVARNIAGTGDAAINVAGEAIFVDSTSPGGLVRPNSTLRLVRSAVRSPGGALGSLEVQGHLFMFRSSLDDVLVHFAGSSLSATSSLFVDGGALATTAIRCSAGCSLELVHSTVTRLGGAGAQPLVVLEDAAFASIAGSSLVNGGTSATVLVAGTAPPPASSLRFSHDNFARHGGNAPPLVGYFAAEIASAAELDASTDVTADHSHEFAAIAFDDDAHPSPTSGLRDASVPELLSLSPSALIDLDGECRYADGNADIGADEAP